MPDSNFKLQLYYNHYKDSFEQIKDYISKRDRITIVLFVWLTIIVFFAIDAGKSTLFVNNLLANKYNVPKIGFDVLNTLCLLVLLYLVFTYYQVCLQIERSYNYLHNVESTLSEMSTLNIDRESQNYLTNYPVVSGIAHLFYTFGLPIVVLAISVVKICIEWPNSIWTMEALDVAILIFAALVSLIYMVDRIVLVRNWSWNFIYDNFMNFLCDKRFWICFAIVVLLLLILVPTIWLIVWLCKNGFGTESGYMGDTISGLSAPIVGILSVLLLVWTLKEQIEFNQKQQQFNDSQIRLTDDEQFKSTFFSLLQEQRDILKSLKATCYTLNKGTTKVERYDVTGQDFFAMALYELRMLFIAMDSPQYQNEYDSDEAFAIMESVDEKRYTGMMLPPELKKENEKMLENAKNFNRQRYITDKYHVTKIEFDRYKSMIEDEKLEYVYSKFYSVYENCGYYFRHLYRILKYVEYTEQSESSLDVTLVTKTREKYLQYAQFIQAQMSRNEMVLLYYNCFLFPKAKDIVIRYKVLQNLSKESLLREEHQRYATEFGMKNKPTYAWIKSIETSFSKPQFDTPKV